jgi:hypothetical protein
MMIRSAEDRAAGKFSAARAEKQRAVSPGSVMGMGVPVPDPRRQQQQQHAGAAAAATSKPASKVEMPRIYTTLSRKEKEEDFMAMKGTKLPQRPKRRPKIVEKTVSVRLYLSLNMSPSLSLSLCSLDVCVRSRRRSAPGCG